MTDWLTATLDDARAAELRRSVRDHRRVAAAARRRRARRLAARAAVLAERSAVLAARAALLSPGPRRGARSDAGADRRTAV
ncbi:hypothetical protein ACI8AA_16110 [Geodermatophilus sp. SYSU D01180]